MLLTLYDPTWGHTLYCKKAIEIVKSGWFWWFKLSRFEIEVTFTFSHLVDALIQSDLQ